MNEYLDFAKTLADEAGAIMKRYFQAEDIGTTWKEDHTPLTLADTKINDNVINAVKKRFPHHGILGEEGSYMPEKEKVWVLDPIDGTVPFMSGIPISTFSLALVDNGKPIMAVQYDPWLNRMYSSVKGGGAYLNDKALKIEDKLVGRSTINLEIYGQLGATMFFDDSVEAKAKEALPSDKFIHFKMVSICYSVGLVASGKLGAAISSGRNPYEAATSSLIIKEAGGKFTNIFGEEDSHFAQPVKGFIAGSATIHSDILKRLLPIVKAAKMRGANS